MNKSNNAGIYRPDYRPLLWELVIRDIKLKYRRSFLGYLWSLLNPLMMMTVMSIVFSFMFKSNIENFPLYLICGYVLFSFFSESTTMAMGSILENGSLLRKVYIPKLIFPISRVFSCFVNMSCSLVAVLIVMVFFRVHFSWTILLFWIPLILLLLFCFGIGLILSSLVVYFRDLAHLYSVITMVWMYLTPIFYPVDSEIFPPYVITIIKCNPLYHYVTFFRSLIIYGSLPTIGTLVFSLCSSILVLFVGLAVFHKLQDRFILYL